MLAIERRKRVWFLVALHMSSQHTFLEVMHPTNFANISAEMFRHVFLQSVKSTERNIALCAFQIGWR